MTFLFFIIQPCLINHFFKQCILILFTTKAGECQFTKNSNADSIHLSHVVNRISKEKNIYVLSTSLNSYLCTKKKNDAIHPILRYL